MSKKDYSIWHNQKTDIENNVTRPFFHLRAVWFCTLGLTVGYEQDGRGDEFLRPVVIIKKFNNEVLWVVPLTTREKSGKYYYSFKLEDQTTSTAILSQLKLIDSKRLRYKIGNINQVDFKELKTKIRQLLA